MVKMKKRIKRIVTTLLAAFLVITQVPASINRVEAANEEYPEYLTCQEFTANEEKYGQAHLDASFDNYFEKVNGEYICINERDMPTLYPHGKHYVSIRQNGTAEVIGYVRCDVYRGETIKDTYFLVQYVHEDGTLIDSESVIDKGCPKEVPSNLGTGHWTLKGKVVDDPSKVEITSATTFVWHKTIEPIEQKYTVSYWDGQNPFNFKDGSSSTEEFKVNEKYTVRDFNGQHDGSEKHIFIGWLTQKGKDEFLKGEGNQVINDKSKLNKILDSKEFREPIIKEYDGLSDKGTINLYAVWANDKAVQGLYDLTINYISDDNEPKKLAESFTGSIEVGESYSVKSPVVEGYTLVNKNQTVISGEMGSKDLVIDVIYSLDANKDNIPDKYQETVVFAVRNGLFENGKTQVEKVVTLVDKNGNWSEDGTYKLTEKDIPGSSPVTGYVNSRSWDANPEGAIIDNKEETKVTFVASYNTKNKFDVRVEFYFDGTIDDSFTETSKEEFGTIFTGAFEKTLELDEKTYALDKVENNGLTVSVDPEKNVVKVYYATDVKGTDPENPDKGDGVPDKYQVKVTFKSENGTIESGKDTVYVTLYDEDGNWDEKGKGYLTQNQIDEAKATPNVGYNIESITWKDDKVPTTDKAITEDTEFTSIFAKGKYPVRIEFYFDGKTNEKFPNETSVEEFETIFTGEFEKTLELDEKTYALDKVENNGLTVSVDPEKNVVKVYYATDVKGTDPENPDKGDGVPDKYQRTVVFAVRNGQFENGKTQVEKVVTLVDENGNWSEDGTYKLTEKDIPGSSPVTGYVDSRSWDANPEGAIIDNKEETKVTFVASYNTKNKFDVRVEFYFDGTIDDSLTETSKEEFGTIFTGAFEKTLEVNGKTYALDKVENNGLRVSANPKENVVQVYYVTDIKGTDPENPDKGDGVPDKYQVEVKFEAVNGTVSMDKTYVTLTDEDGNYSENGKGFLTEEQIAVAKASDGYDQDSLVWTPVVPTKDVEITKAMTFTATFEEIEQPVVPVDPVDPPVGPTDPEAPVTPENPDITVTPDPETPATNNPVTTTPATPEVTTPVDNTPAQVDGEPVVDVVEDENTPLANLPEEDVDDNQTPLAGLNGGWALVNLICTAVTVLFGLFLLISKKKKEEDKEDDEKQMNVNMDEDAEEIRKRGMFTRILSVIVAIVSVIVFFLTEDLTLKMVMTDKWTLLMVVFALVQVVIFFVGRKWKSPKGNKPEQQAAMQK